MLSLRRRDQQVLLKPAVAAIVDDLNRLAKFTVKRDETLQQKIQESIKKGKKRTK